MAIQNDDKLKMVISKNLKHYRELKNETSIELAEQIGVSQSTISDWERGQKMPRSGSMQKLADHFEISMDDLVSDKTKTQTADLIAAHIDDDASPEEVKQILDYIDYIKSKHQDD
ncbi:helix-turn-helix domain-containing protein [Furfurilactobacillus entadae]|uniref:helix-turn-helix domain-containing protein n=1 Tax=Furfurilactobacillus entadae TaxID=2922307 RepID=UPI0035EBE636